jgi:cobalamin biosynthesis protein CobC
MQAVSIIAPAQAGHVRHGGDLTSVQQRFPDAPQPWIDLSTGINPRSYPIAGLPREAWTRLPSRGAERALAEAAATRYGCRAEQVVISPGTQALIQLLPRLAQPSCVAIVGPTYAEHALCWGREGHRVFTAHTLRETADADVVVIVNPDNPSGRLVDPPILRGLDARLLVVDEAFIDLLPPDASLAADVPSNTVVLRSFGKTYGLAGLRLGFAIAPIAIAERLREVLGPWAVSGPALKIAERALRDEAWLSAERGRLAGDGARLEALLESAGFTVVGRTPLFVLGRHPETPGLVERLGHHGIHVRAFDHRPDWIRFGLPDSDDSFGRLAAALQVPQKVR